MIVCVETSITKLVFAGYLTAVETEFYENDSEYNIMLEGGVLNSVKVEDDKRISLYDIDNHCIRQVGSVYEKFYAVIDNAEINPPVGMFMTTADEWNLPNAVAVCNGRVVGPHMWSDREFIFANHNGRVMAWSHDGISLDGDSEYKLFVFKVCSES